MKRRSFFVSILVIGCLIASSALISSVVIAQSDIEESQICDGGTQNQDGKVGCSED
jgi:hypothetical protein